MSFDAQNRNCPRFRRRVLVAGGFVMLCFVVLAARFAWLQVSRFDYYHTRAEGQPHRAGADRPQSRPDHRPQRGGAGAQLRHLHARDHPSSLRTWTKRSMRWPRSSISSQRIDVDFARFSTSKNFERTDPHAPHG